MLVSEIRGEKLLEETLRTLQADTGSNVAPELVQLKQEVYHRVAKHADKEGLKMFDWYIPRDNVTINEDDGWIGNGAFDDVSHGSLLLKNGDKKNVVVEQLFSELTNHARSSELFHEQLEFWSNLMRNEKIPKTHILEL